ncbi:MAG: hypothetical protein HY749_22675 [Gammaproteobacteria bacterium]|nr:hypothetical protein [Gammaproteobacteria bacterium]MBI5615187.1 hypothetical protein [Gammaproteobacteria bacterium]
MKKNETPQLAASWWKGAQPEGLASAKDLDKALVAYEDARKELGKAKNDAAKKLTGNALDAIATAAKKVQMEAEKLAKNPPKKADPEDYLNTADVMKKVPRVIESVEKTLGRLVEAGPGGDAEEEDDEQGAFGKLDVYGAYLRKMLKRLRAKPMNFAVGIGRKPEDHRFVFHRSKPAKALSALIRQETDLKRVTWGIAGADPDRPMLLVLALEGPQAPGLKKKGEKHMKLLKPLPFARIMLMVEGEEAEDIVDPDDPDDASDEIEEEEDESAEAKEDAVAEVKAEQGPAFAARLKELLPKIQRLAGANPEEAQNAKLKASEAGVFARKQDFASANRLLDELQALLGAGKEAPAPTSPTGSKVVFTQSRLAWVAARNKVHAELQKLEASILEVYRDDDVFGEVRSGVRRLDGILEALDEELIDKLDEALNAVDAAAHARSIGEARAIIQRYRRFLETDPLVKAVDTNPFVAVAVESTMNKTLAVLEAKIV